MALHKMIISVSLLLVLTSTTLFIWLKISYNKLSCATRVLLTLCTCVSVYFLYFWSHIWIVCIGEKRTNGKY